MIAWERIDEVTTPDGEPMVLSRRGQEFEIRVAGQQLMSSSVHGSEDELARLVCAGLGGIAAPRVLIGGLGIGYTLRAALDALPQAAVVTVAELIPAVVSWNEGPLGHLADFPLRDARVRVEVSDVREVLVRTASALDAIVLDVDNGPEGLTARDNDRLYGGRGLETCWRALAPGGWLGVWSADPNDAFVRRLRAGGFDVEVRNVRAHANRRGSRHTIFLARRRERAPGATARRHG